MLLPVKLVSAVAAVAVLAAVAAASALGYYEIYHRTATISWEMAPFCTSNESGPNCIYKWLKQHRLEIVRQAKKRRISRLAIGGVIAFESLEDVDPPEVAPLSRYSGPGKVHYKNWRLWEGEPVAKAVEDRGYLPKETMTARRRILATPRGAILYIATILQAYKNIAQMHGYLIGCRPDILATFYSAWDFGGERQLLTRRPKRLISNDIGSWILTERTFLVNALGEPDAECRSSTKPPERRANRASRAAL